MQPSEVSDTPSGPIVQMLRRPVSNDEDPFLGVVFAGISVVDAEAHPLLRQLREQPGDTIGGGSPERSMLGSAIKAHGGQRVGRFFQSPQLMPISRFTPSPLEALDALGLENGLLIALMLRRSRVFFMADETSFDIIVLAEDQAQVIAWRDGGCPYRASDQTVPEVCEEGLLADVRSGNDTIVRRAGLDAFPQPLRFIQTSN